MHDMKFMSFLRSAEVSTLDDVRPGPPVSPYLPRWSVEALELRKFEKEGHSGQPPACAAIRRKHSESELQKRELQLTGRRARLKPLEVEVAIVKTQLGLDGFFSKSLFTLSKRRIFSIFILFSRPPRARSARSGQRGPGAGGAERIKPRAQHEHNG